MISPTDQRHKADVAWPQHHRRSELHRLPVADWHNSDGPAAEDLTLSARQPPLIAQNYCVAFIDLLGQRAALEGEGLLPPAITSANQSAFIERARKSVGAILALQEQAETLLGPLLDAESRATDLRDKLSPEQQAHWDQMRKAHVTTQRWSDGLVSFVGLGDGKVKCPTVGVFAIFGLSGCLCLLGLAGSHPLRGAIDVSWGVELKPGELYGAVIANAYKLESEVAQYPRVVVSDRTVEYLRAMASRREADIYAALERQMANVCLQMIVQDSDGQWIIHYLGAEFRSSWTAAEHGQLLKLAITFAERQLTDHQTSGNDKLASRYSWLLDYLRIE